MEAADLQAPVAELQLRLDDAMADETALSGDQRRARGALLGRQLTIR
jgi:hypothetical protein